MPPFNFPKSFNHGRIMRLLYQTLFVIVVGFVLAQVLPWWSLAIAGMGAGYLWSGRRGRSFLAGFVGGLLLWSGAAIAMTQMTGSDLGDKFAQLMGLPASATLLAIVSGVLAGIVAGLAGMSGDSLRQAFAPQKPR